MVVPRRSKIDWEDFLAFLLSGSLYMAWRSRMAEVSPPVKVRELFGKLYS